MTTVNLTNRRILLGVSGGIAAYKSTEIIRLLKKSGAEVRVVMTASAREFITPLTLQALSGNEVHLDLLDPKAEAAMGHIELARWADLVLLAPASANTLAKLAHGQADDLLSTLILASEAKKLFAPAMNTKMWLNENTQDNHARLTKQGVIWIGPEEGEQACGEWGPGRMAEPADIVLACARQFENKALSGKKVVITAGPTREAIDPVRYISNHSSGKMGFALAQAAIDAGAQVVLISGPVNLPTPDRAVRKNVVSAQEMLEESLIHSQQCDIFIACAAVADYRPETCAKQKIKKGKGSNTLSLTLVKNPDIVSQIAAQAKKPFILGFAAETQNLLDHAKSKLENKGMNMIAANDVSEEGIGFNSEKNAVTLIYRRNNALHEEKLKLNNKFNLACQIIDRVAQQLESN